MAGDHSFYLICSYGAMAAVIAIELFALRRRRRAAIALARIKRQRD